MNIEHIDNVIASIKGEIPKTETLGFNMSRFVDEADDRLGRRYKDQSNRSCGTIACIAGHAYVLANKKRTIEDALEIANGFNSESVVASSQRYLGLNTQQREALFYGDGHGEHSTLAEITSAQAITTLEKLKKTGEVDWSHVK